MRPWRAREVLGPCLVRYRRVRRIAITIGTAAGFLGAALAGGSYSPEAVGALDVLVWWAVLVGLFGAGWRKRALPRAAVLAVLGAVGLALLSVASLGWALDGGAAFEAANRALLYAGLLTLVALATAPDDVRPCLAGLAIGAVAIAAVALLSRFEPSFPGGDAQLAAELPSARGRLSYPIDYWNGLAACLALGVVLLAWFGSEARSRFASATATGALPLLAIAMYYTASRGGVVAASAGLLVLVAVGGSRPRLLLSTGLGLAGAAALIALARTGPELLRGATTPLAAKQGDQMLAACLGAALAVAVCRFALDARLAAVRVKPPLGKIAVGVAVVATIAAVIVANPGKRIDELTHQPSPPPAPNQLVATHLLSGSGSGRWQFWGNALDAFGGEPLYGLGAGGWASYWNELRPISSPARNAHSLYLETLAELGIAGFALLLVFLVSPFVVLRRRARTNGWSAVAPLFAILTTGLVSAGIDWTWQLPAAFGPVVLAAGLLVGPATLARTEVEQIRWPRLAARVGLYGLTLLALGAVWAGGTLFLSELAVSRSAAAAATGDQEAALRDANLAISLEGFASSGWVQRALVEEGEGRIDASRADLENAIARAPNDWRLYLIAARLAVKADDIPRAETDLSAARLLNPLAPLFQ